jgi:hypothetical protein
VPLPLELLLELLELPPLPLSTGSSSGGSGGVGVTRPAIALFIAFTASATSLGVAPAFARTLCAAASADVSVCHDSEV